MCAFFLVWIINCMHYSCGTNQILSPPPKKKQFTNHFVTNYILKAAKRKRQNESSKRENTILESEPGPSKHKHDLRCHGRTDAVCKLCSWEAQILQLISDRRGRDGWYKDREFLICSNHIKLLVQVEIILSMLSNILVCQ